MLDPARLSLKDEECFALTLMIGDEQFSRNSGIPCPGPEGIGSLIGLSFQKLRGFRTER